MGRRVIWFGPRGARDNSPRFQPWKESGRQGALEGRYRRLLLVSARRRMRPRFRRGHQKVAVQAVSPLSEVLKFCRRIPTAETVGYYLWPLRGETPAEQRHRISAFGLDPNSQPNATAIGHDRADWWT